MQHLRTTRDADEVLTVWLDVPEKPVNTISPQTLAELSDVLNEIELSRPRAVIFASGKPHHFAAGADLFAIRKMDRDELAKFLREGQALFERVAQLPITTVAALNGDCLGGGMELALACDVRVAADEPSANLGLPEVKLGILPGWGGTNRLPRLIGLPKALSLLLAGKTMPPKKAMRAGIVHEVVRPEALMAAARRLALAPPANRNVGLMHRAATALSMTRERMLAAAAAQTMSQTRGQYPAPMKLIDVLRTSYAHGMRAGLEAERTALTDLMDTDACRNLMRLFFLRQNAKKTLAAKLSAKGRDVKHAVVVGGGTMGAGIVHAMAKAGIAVRLIEVNADAAAAGLGRVRKMLGDDVAAGRMTLLAARHALNRVAPTTEWTGLKLADLVVEAVVERMDEKRDVFAKLDAMTRPDCVLASNTSSLSITEMAKVTTHPGRVVGLHFFNPVPKMPLVEVVRGVASDDAALATAAMLTTRFGKTALLVNDAPGFVVNRVLIPYLAEALALAGEGTPIRTIDAAMKDWGMPMGPFELLDEIGLDVSRHVLHSLGAQTSSGLVVSPVMDEALERGWLGKKAGRGFYVYPNPKAKRSAEPTVNGEMAALLGRGAHARPTPGAARSDAAETSARVEAIQWRLVLPMVNEAARLIEERVVDSTEAIDLATVLGLGLAPFRGGLARFADTVGSDQLVSRLEALAAVRGERFKPAMLLKRLASAHRMLSEFERLDQPVAAAAAQMT